MTTRFEVSGFFKVAVAVCMTTLSPDDSSPDMDVLFDQISDDSSAFFSIVAKEGYFGLASRGSRFRWISLFPENFSGQRLL